MNKKVILILAVMLLVSVVIISACTKDNGSSEIIIERACKELEVDGTGAELKLLYVDSAKWIDGEINGYILTLKDGTKYLVDVIENDGKIELVDVIEKVTVELV